MPKAQLIELKVYDSWWLRPVEIFKYDDYNFKVYEDLNQ
jgi:hypothetical protein